MNIVRQARKLLERKGYIDKGWEVQSSSIVICPCGHRIEWDGTCPEGHESPLRELGYI